MTNGIKLFDLTGKRVLITGSSQGIGFTLARGLGEAGAAVVINGRNEEKLADAAVELKKQGIAVDQLAFDVTDHAAVASAVSHLSLIHI